LSEKMVPRIRAYPPDALKIKKMMSSEKRLDG
jgi:hypothetical protein